MSDSLEISNSTISLNPAGQISVANHIRERLVAKPEPRLKSVLNPLLEASYPLFAWVSRLQLMPQSFDHAVLQQHLLDLIQQYEQHCQKLKVRQEQMLLGRYFLCSLLDDILAHGPSDGFNPAFSLLSHYNQESLQDNRLFALIDRLHENPAANLFLLELAYMILVYGYFGQYRQDPHGYAIILEKQDALYHLIRWQHGDFRKNLFITLSSS